MYAARVSPARHLTARFLHAARGRSSRELRPISLSVFYLWYFNPLIHLLRASRPAFSVQYTTKGIYQSILSALVSY